MEVQLRGLAVRGDLPTVRRILQQSVNVNAGNEHGDTALHFAVLKGHIAIVQAILQVDGVNVDSRTLKGHTPLHWAWAYRASIGDRLPIIQALLEAGADPNAADFAGNTPLYCYIINGCPISAVEALLARGANPAARNNNHNTALHFACCLGDQLDIAKLLIDRCGVESECLTIKNIDGRTPLDSLRYSHSQEASDPIRIHIIQSIIQCYAQVLAQRDGRQCVHNLLCNTAFTHDTGFFRVPIGNLDAQDLQTLLGRLIAAEPGSVRALDRDGLVPVQVACQLNFPALVIHVLLRPYPGALLLL